MNPEAVPQNKAKLGEPPRCVCGLSLGIGYIDMSPGSRAHLATASHDFDCPECEEWQKANKPKT